MAITRYLNDYEDVWVTTYYGGKDRGTCFDISMQMSNNTQYTATFTHDKLAQILQVLGEKKPLARPCVDGELIY